MNSIHKYDELTRRAVLQSIAYSSLGVSIGSSLSSNKIEAAIPGARVASAKQVVYLYMSGGMSQLDTFDPKPKHPELMGETKAIPTKIDHCQMGGNLSALANISDRLAVVRSMNVTTGSHEQANYIAHTNYDQRPDIMHPCMGSWVTQLSGTNNPSIPGNIRINGGSPTGAGFFDSSHTPLIVRRPDQGIQYSKKSKFISEKNFKDRMSLLNKVNDNYLKTHNTKRVKDYNYAYEAAINLMRSQDLKAFDLDEEPESMKNKYGNNSFGQGCLLARRLVEQKARFIEVDLGGWDHHFKIYDEFPDKAKILDQAMSTLVLDLEQRGLLQETLIVLTTEFGRTPMITEARAGRDHYPQAFSTVLAGGGIKGGVLYGETDDTCAGIVDKPVYHKDINATIGYAMGLPLEKILHSTSGRPFTAANKGKPLFELFDRPKNA